jgi:hypothetical protein
MIYEEYIKKWSDEADQHLDDAKALTKKAIEFIDAGDTRGAAKFYFDTGREYFLASVNFKSVSIILEKILRVGSTDTRFNENKAKRIEAIQNSATCYEKSGTFFSKLDKFRASDAYGLAATNYANLAELTGEKDVYRKVPEDGGVFELLMDTPIGKAMEAYLNAALIFYDIGITYRNSGNIGQAYPVIGDMGDAYLSRAVLCEAVDNGLAAESYFNAAEAYKEAGLLARKAGISTVVFHIRMEWKYTQQRGIDLLKDQNGYFAFDDIKRAISIYPKARELFIGLKDTKRANECSKAILSLSKETEEPKDSIKSCQEICESISELTVLPIDLSSRRLEKADKEIIKSSIKAFVDDPKNGAYQLIGYLEQKLRVYIKSKLSPHDSVDWFRTLVVPAIGEGLRVISDNYQKETQKDPQELFSESNPLDYANINHLQKIISQHWQFFRNFEPKDEFEANMIIIVKYRHRTMHVRNSDFEAVILPAVWILEKLV